MFGVAIALSTAVGFAIIVAIILSGFQDEKSKIIGKHWRNP